MHPAPGSAQILEQSAPAIRPVVAISSRQQHGFECHTGPQRPLVGASPLDGVTAQPSPTPRRRGATNIRQDGAPRLATLPLLAAPQLTPPRFGRSWIRMIPPGGNDALLYTRPVAIDTGSGSSFRESRA